MSKIVFFSIPAYGHTNPTIEVIRELTKYGHKVLYYSFDEFKEIIENAGAAFVSCDAYLPPAPPDLEKKVGKDFSALIEMLADTTMNLDEKVCTELREYKPDCIVSDSMCFWGKLFAIKLKIPYICSTTTFAFNQYTAKMLKRGFREIITMLVGMPHVNKKMKKLQEYGYAADGFLSIIQNDNNTDTIVYTSKEFQPMSETFSDKYYFVGPSITKTDDMPQKKQQTTIYISLGTILNKDNNFYKNCLEAFRDTKYEVVMSVGERTNIKELGNIPENFHVENRVNQINVLQYSDVFITHCGMNSANESIYFGVPAVMFPQQSEEVMVAKRMEELGIGVILKNDTPEQIKKAVADVLKNNTYKTKAEIIAQSFKKAGGAKKAAEAIIKLAEVK